MTRVHGNERSHHWEITSVSTNATTLYVGEQLIDRILDNRGNPILDSSGNVITSF